MAVTYPLGLGADPTKNHRTPANRKAVGYCLRVFWNGGAEAVASAVHRKADSGGSAIGLSISGRFVTRIELAEALGKLATDRSDLSLALYRVFAHNLTIAVAASQLAVSDVTLGRRVSDGLNYLVDELWR